MPHVRGRVNVPFRPDWRLVRRGRGGFTSGPRRATTICVRTERCAIFTSPLQSPPSIDSPAPSDRLIHDRLVAFARELDGVERLDPIALHRARVASRRLRELMPLLELDRETSQDFSRQLRKVTRQLGAVRELDVLIGSIDEFDRRRRHGTATLTSLRAAVDKRRTSARKRLAAKLPRRKLERLVNRLERTVRFRSAALTKGDVTAPKLSDPRAIPQQRGLHVGRGRIQRRWRCEVSCRKAHDRGRRGANRLGAAHSGERTDRRGPWPVTPRNTPTTVHPSATTVVDLTMTRRFGAASALFARHGNIESSPGVNGVCPRSP